MSASPLQALHHTLQPAGPQAGHIAQLWWFTLAICALVFIAVLAAFAWALWRAPRADERTGPDTAPLHHAEHGTRAAVTGAVALSVALLVILVGASAATDHALQRLPLEGALQLHVVGHQWWWEVRYDDPEPSRAFTTANELVIPVGRPVVVKLTSPDVIHSFWIPNLHGKKDLIPGIEATTQLRADVAGTYRGICAEYCGAQHAFMSFVVRAVPPAEYDRWSEAQRAPAAEPSDASAKRGRDLFVSASCMLCHAIQGTTAQGRNAPDLTHVASRPTLAAGRLENTPENMASWIEDPQRHKPGANMPGHKLPAEDLRALVAYLTSLK
jgi:cytochrome c oxidase subunit 2